MQFNLPEELINLYKDDFKMLKNGTILFGHLFEERWQTHLQRPLNHHEIKEMEEEYGVLPHKYKELLLMTNGCYLFDLINIAGKQFDPRGMTREAQIYQSTSLYNIQPYLGKKELPKHLFGFADSMIHDHFYAFNPAGQVLEIDTRSLKTVNTYATLEELLKETFKQGKEMVLKNEYIDFY